MKLFDLFGVITVEDKQANTAIASVDDKAKALGESFVKVGKVVGTAMLATGAAIGAVGLSALDSATDAEEMRNKYEVVFDDMVDEADEWSESFSDSVGRSKFAVQESLANLADLQQGLGMTTEESLELSKKIVSLGTDLASFNNLQDADAIEAISKAMLGEADSAKQLGLLLNVDRVKEYVEAQGLVYENLTDAEMAQQVYNLAVTQSQNAIGDAERSSGSYTNQMKALKASLEDAKTELGMKLIPIATQFVTFLNDKMIPRLGEWIDNLDTMSTNIGKEYAPEIDKMKETFAKLKEEMDNMTDENSEELKDLFKALAFELTPAVVTTFANLLRVAVQLSPLMTEMALAAANMATAFAQLLALDFKGLNETLSEGLEMMWGYKAVKWAGEKVGELEGTTGMESKVSPSQMQGRSRGVGDTQNIITINNPDFRDPIQVDDMMDELTNRIRMAGGY